MGGAYAPPVRSFAVGVPILVWHIGSEFHGDPLLLDRGPVGGDLGFGFGTVLLVYELDLYPALVLGLLLGLLLLLEGFTGGLVLVTVLGDEGLPLLDLRLGLLLLGGTVFLGDGFQGLLAFVPLLPERDLLVLVPVLLGLDLLLLGFGHLFMPGCSLRLIFLRHFEHLGMSSRNLTKIRDTR